MEQIESKREQVPLALMPTIWMRGLEIEIDGIANNTRYYKVAEYIYQNYRPLCRVDNIAIWCSKERYQELFYPTEKEWREKTVEDFAAACRGVLNAKLVTN